MFEKCVLPKNYLHTTVQDLHLLNKKLCHASGCLVLVVIISPKRVSKSSAFNSECPGECDT